MLMVWAAATHSQWRLRVQAAKLRQKFYFSKRASEFSHTLGHAQRIAAVSGASAFPSIARELARSKVSADRWSSGRLRLRCPTVGPTQIADVYSTAFLRVIAFPHRTAYRRRSADLGPPVCRNPIAYYPRPLLHLRLSFLYSQSVNKLQKPQSAACPPHLRSRPIWRVDAAS